MKDRRKLVVQVGGDIRATNTANDGDKRGPATDGSDRVGFWEWIRERWICMGTNPCDRGCGAQMGVLDWMGMTMWMLASGYVTCGICMCYAQFLLPRLSYLYSTSSNYFFFEFYNYNNKWLIYITLFIKLPVE